MENLEYHIMSFHWCSQLIWFAYLSNIHSRLQIPFIFNYLDVFVFPVISFKVPDTEVNIFQRTRGYSEISHGRGNRFIQFNEECTYPQCSLSWLWPSFDMLDRLVILSSVALPSFFLALTSPSAQNSRNTALIVRDIEGNVSQLVFSGGHKNPCNMAWSTGPPPYHRINLIYLEREVCLNNTCQMNGW